MSGLENLKARLSYQGGNQEQRMQSDKLRSLKKALLYSYQAATAILADNREFRCLMNPDKNSLDYEDMILSIPYKDICLNKEKTAEKTSQGEEEIGLKVGDVFTWKETATKWLVYLQMIEEDAYFRAQVRKCNYEIQVNDNIYDAYVKGPDAHTLLWHTRRGVGSWSDLNYDAEMYITKNEETEAFFHRFTKIKIKDKPWEVVAVDNISSEGIITLFLQETFSNTIEEEGKKEEENNSQPGVQDPTQPHIDGDAIVYPYDIKQYTIKNEEGGQWYLSNNKAKINQQDSSSVTIEITTGRSGSVDLIYKKEGIEDIILSITIQSL